MAVLRSPTPELSGPRVQIAADELTDLVGTVVALSAATGSCRTRRHRVYAIAIRLVRRAQREAVAACDIADFVHEVAEADDVHGWGTGCAGRPGLRRVRL